MADAILTPYSAHVHYNIDAETQDAVSNSSPVLDMFLQKRELFNGIAKVIPNFSAATTVANYDPTGTAAVSQANTSSVLKAPSFGNLGHYVCDYMISLQDKEIGGSALAVVKTEADRRMAAKKSVVEALGTAIFSGTGSSNTARGIDYLIDPTATTDWGGADANDFAGWDSPASSTATVLNQLSDLTAQINACSVNGSKPDRGFTTQTLWVRLLDLVGPSNIITNGTGTATLGFTGLNYMGVKFEEDRHATSGYLYILTSSDLGLLHGELFADTGLAPISNLYKHETGLISSAIQPFSYNRRIHSGFTSLSVS
jgi:hypothetical protein